MIAYRRKHARCNVPIGWKENPQLGRWCHTQTELYAKDALIPDRVRRLSELGFVWDLRDASWEEMFAALVAYKKEHKDCNVPQLWKENSHLASWCVTQRSRYKNGTLPPDRFKRLDELGFVWDLLDAKWEDGLAALIAYKEKHGNCEVPHRLKDNPELGDWCRIKRSSYKRGSLPPERVKQLDELGFVWNLLDARWEEMFAALVAYKKEHKDCNVPRKWKENPRLGVWCGTQRRNYKMGTLPPERVKQLDELGFVWDLLDANWEDGLAALIAYKEKHGTCEVPYRLKDNPGLGDWCREKRHGYKRGTLPPEYVKQLDELGFVWNLLDARWEEMFAALVAYKKEHKDCNVPQEWKENPRLGAWCGTQRRNYKKGGLHPERVKRLEAIDFVWKASSQRSHPARARRTR